MWPFIKSMSPAEDTLALGTTEVDISDIEEGQSITVKWRGKPVFIKKELNKKLKKQKWLIYQNLIDPEDDIAERVKERRMVSFSWCMYSSWLCTTWSKTNRYERRI